MNYMHVLNGDAFGLIVWENWIDVDDPTPLWEQVDRNYGHGGGWRDFDGFEILAGSGDEPFSMQYPDDPPYTERGRITRGHDNVTGPEYLMSMGHGWMLWVHGDTHKVARID